ncbi:MAG: hypothetical protein AAF709_11350 [Pseudomonadota bacterium]
MSLATYADLQTSIGDWINRPNLSSVYADLIRLAEAHFDRTLKTREMEVTTTPSISSGSRAIETDYLATISLRVDGDPRRDEVTYVSPDEYDQFRDCTGGPTHYTIVGDTMLFWPQPSEATSLSFRYRQQIPRLSDSNTSNWLLSKYPDAYLWGSLAEASDYIADERRLQRYISRRDAALEMINKVDREKINARRRVRPSSAVA